MGAQKQNRSTERCSRFKVRKHNKFMRKWSQHKIKCKFQKTSEASSSVTKTKLDLPRAVSHKKLYYEFRILHK